MGFDVKSVIHPDQAIELIEQAIAEKCGSGGIALEAGCGSASRVKALEKMELHGLDISQKQLDRNQQIKKKFCGDLHEYKFDSQYSVVISSFVFEHLNDPERALKNLAQSLESSGKLVLLLPNVMSLKGLITKFTPHWFHIFYYKYVLGHKDAGKNDTVPFPTTLRLSFSARNLPRLATQMGLEPELLCFFGDPDRYIKKYKALNFAFCTVNKIFSRLSFGLLSEQSEMVFVARKL